MKAYIILAIILIGIPLLILGFNEVPENCDCKGLGENHCLGKITCKNNSSECIPITCENKEEFLGILDLTQEKNYAYTVLIIDASKSMEGENMDATTKASKNFAQQLNQQEHVAVIEFNEEAQILTDFTTDQITLFKSIDLIYPKGRTRFYEPFFLANKLFENVPTETNKYILFLSDGTPEDDLNLFMKEVNMLKENNVNIYTLAFAGKSNEELMEEIASGKSNIFTVTTAKDIEEKFVQIYSTIAKERDLKISLINQAPTIKTSDNILAKITSTHNNKNIFTQEKYCELKTSTYLEARNDKKQFSRIMGELANGIFSFPLSELKSGDYDITIYSKIHLDACSLSKTARFSTVKILQETDCQTSCELINKVMKGTKNFSYQRNNSKSISWNVLIDTSSSMDKHRHLDKAKQDIKTIISYLAMRDTISIGTFDKKVNLIEIHTPKYLLNQSEFPTIIPTFSTRLITALQKFKELEANSPLQTNHHIIISDGDYLEDELKEIENILQNLTGCITTVNYGVHLLVKEEQAFELIKKYRTCGTDLITQPTQEEYQQIIGTSISKIPELAISFTKDQSNKTILTPHITSTFTGVEPNIQEANCFIQPHITTKIKRENDEIEIIQDKSFEIKNNNSFNSIATFGNEGCFYETTKTYQQIEEEKPNNLLKILAAVLIVFIIHLLVFTIVMNKKLKKMKQMIDRRKKY